MKNPITRIVYLSFSIALIYALFQNGEENAVSLQKFELMVYLVGSITIMLVLRAETLGTIFTNISEGIKNKWKEK